MYIDVPKIKDYFKFSQKQMDDLLAIFISTMESDWKTLEIGIAAKDMMTVQKTAHKMKTSYGYFLIDHFKSQMQLIEDLSKVQNVDLLMEVWRKIEIDKIELNKEMRLLIK